ncbi:PREDICTED: uncharacterized protein LOC104799701 [Tarenaya hassleriana]|uniref:uncharacterized protein LOC104799701 n=1 Tax=Tarenaya hassleriana TaxID=28532 RepID=UPI00053C1D30|nr:PREDICTED: uncharacterized protein LOC104799701 [Tarenaya hassleriana]
MPQTTNTSSPPRKRGIGFVKPNQRLTGIPWYGVEGLSPGTLLVWQVMQQRLPTRDRLRRWGLQTDEKCVLCGEEEESHLHLFFECSYSANIWVYFASCCWNSPPENLEACQDWITRVGNDKGKSRVVLSKLLLQLTVYVLWNERNTRIFRNKEKPLEVMRRHLDKSMRNLLLSMKERRTTTNNLLLEDWYFLTSSLRM